MDFFELMKPIVGWGSLIFMAAIVFAYFEDDDIRRKTSLAHLVGAIVFFGGIGGYMIFDTNNEGRAYDFVISAVQEKQRLFKDQYKLSMPMDNDRGTLVLVTVTDEKLLSEDGYKYLVYVLSKQQDNPKYYHPRYTRIFLAKLPDKDKLNEIARDAGLLD